MATLTVTIKEELILNGSERGSENVKSIASVTEMMERIIDVPTASEVTLVDFGTTTGGSTFINNPTDSIKYIRITSLDDTNFTVLRVRGTQDEEYFVRLEPEGSFVIFNSLIDANETGGQVVSKDEIDSIKAQANTADVQLEVFVAV